MKDLVVSRHILLDRKGGKAQWYKALVLPHWRSHTSGSTHDVRTRMSEQEMVALFKDNRVVRYLQYYIGYSTVDQSCIGAIIGDADPKYRAKRVIRTLYSQKILPAYHPQILTRVRWGLFEVRRGCVPSPEDLNEPAAKKYHNGTIRVLTGHPIPKIHYTREWDNGFSEQLFEYADVLQPICDAILEAAHKTGREPHKVAVECAVDNNNEIYIPAWIILELAQHK